MMKRLNNERGFAIVLSLLIIAVLLILGSIFVLRTVNEWNTANRERRITQAFYASEGGAEAGLDMLDTLINTYMLTTISNVNPSTVVSVTQNYVNNGDGIGFLILSVLNGGVAQLTLDGTDAIYTSALLANGSSGNYQYKIIISEKQDPFANGTDRWEFPYYYRIESNGTSGAHTRKVQLVGDFTVEVQRDNFAKYALFTNQQKLPNGTNVWFTDKTNFSGPLHTNDRFNIALNPSGTFDGAVVQHQDTARFYNQGATVLLDADFNGTKDVPTFNAGFTRGASQINLSSPVQEQDMIDQASGGTTFGSDGIYIPNNGTNLTGGIYVQGDANVSLSVDGSDNPVYTVTQGAATKTITVDRANNQTIVVPSTGPTETYAGSPNGVDGVGTILFVNGKINSLGGTVQKDTSLTISSESDIKITNNLVYANYTPGTGTPGTVGYVPPNADGTDNLLGLVTWNGDVRVDTAAPNNINVHGTLLARNGKVQVDNYNDTGVGPRGTATLLGGVISDYYGAFGLFNGSTGQQISGYGRNFVYDSRLLVGNAPPYFPTLNTFIAFTNDLIDKITLQEGGF